MIKRQKNILIKLISVLISVTLIIPSGMVCRADETIAIYVSADGKESGTGSIDNPLPSLKAARDKIRTIRAESDTDKTINVYIRGGIYNMDEQLLLTKEDSGTKENPVIWRNYKNESVTLTGGINVTGKDFKRVTENAILNRIVDYRARKTVYSLDLKNYGVTDTGEPYYKGSYSYSSSLKKLGLVDAGETPGIEVFYNGTAMTNARYPNEGNLTVQSVIAPGWDYDNQEAYPAGTPFTVSLSDDRMKYWTVAPEGTILMYGFWKFKWADQTIPIGSIDVRNKRLTSKWHSDFSVTEGAPFYVYNLLEEMDMPGEYYIDRQNSILYINAPEDIETANITVSLLEDELIYVNGADYLSFEGLTVHSSRKTPLRLENCTGCSVRQCEIYNIGDYGVKMAGTENVVSGCHIYDVNGGVSVWGGDEKTLTGANNQVLNCHIERFSRLDKTYKPAVNLGGVGNLAAFNKIHDAPHQAIAYGGNNNKIYYNEIYDVVQSTDDAGAVYGGLSWVSRGHEIKYNYIHDLASDQPGVGIWGVFLDGGQCGITIEGNIFENIDGDAVFVSGGRDNVVNNNYSIGCDSMFRIIQSIGQEDLERHHYPRLHSFVWKNGEWKSDIWKEAYPEFYEMMKLSDEEKVIPANNVFENNICYKNSALVLRNDAWLAADYKEKNYLTESDPGFVSLDDEPDYSLKKDAPVLETLPELERLPFNCMGLSGSPACLNSQGFYCERVRDEVICQLCLNAEKSDKVFLLHAVYKKDGDELTFEDIQNEQLSFDEGERVHHRKIINAEDNTAVQCFLWSQSNLRPLCSNGAEK